MTNADTRSFIKQTGSVSKGKSNFSSAPVSSVVGHSEKRTSRDVSEATSQIRAAY